MVFGKVSYGQFEVNEQGQKVKRAAKEGDEALIELRELRQLVDEAKHKSYDSFLIDFQTKIIKTNLKAAKETL